MKNSADNRPTSPATRPKRSLRSKIFLPFFCITVILGVAVIYSATYMIKTSFTRNSDDRLNAAREVLFREFKRQEVVLETYASFLQHFQALSLKFDDYNEIGILQDRLFNTLEDSDISVSFYPVTVKDALPFESLKALFEQTIRSEQVRFRYTNELSGVPVLMAAAPMRLENQIEQIIVLQTTMGEGFLQKIAAPLDVRILLHNLDGELLARSHKDATVIELTAAQFTQVGMGQELHLEHEGHDGRPERHLLTAIPLGSSELVLLSLEASIESSKTAQQAIAIRIGAVIIGCLLLGTAIYFRLAGRITEPVKTLHNATQAINRGNLNHRIHDISNDELGLVAASFNEMARNLEKSYNERSGEDIEKALLQEKARSKIALEKKDQEHKRVTDEFKSLQRETNALLQLNKAMISSIDLNILFDRILQVMNEVLDCDHLVLLVYNPGDSMLEVTRTAGLDSEALQDVKFSFSQGITGEAAQSQKTIYVKDVEMDDRNLSYHGQIATRGSLVSCPLVVKGRLVGVLNLHKKQTDAFSASELRLVQAVANQTAIAIDNTQLLERARDLSNTDELTGLANRRHFQEILKREVAQARRFSSIFSIVMCDIDHFKEFNDKHGRMQADALLKQVGQLLLKSTRGIDLVCRFGNEEFVLLLPKTNKKGAIATAEKLRRMIEQFHVSGVADNQPELKITMSFGVTEFPIDSKNIYELLNLADRALYAAKKEGRNRTVAWEGPAPGPD